MSRVSLRRRCRADTVGQGIVSILFVVCLSLPGFGCAATPTALPTTSIAQVSATATPAIVAVSASSVTALPTGTVGKGTPASTPSATPLPRATPTQGALTRVPMPTPLSYRPSPASTDNRSNGLFDVIVLVDARMSYVPNRAAVESVFEIAAGQMAARTGEWMRLTDVVYGRSRPQTGNEYQQITAFVQEYLSSLAGNLPDGILALSDTETCLLAGGFSLSIKAPAPFRNEFPSPRPDVGSDKMYVAVVDFDHIYSQCGYDQPGAGQKHVSDVSIDGECRNRPGLRCVRNGDIWQCPGVEKDLYYNHDFFLGSMIVHEFLHPFGIDPNDLNLDHYASSSCIQRKGVTAQQVTALATDVYEAQLNLGLCPDVFARFKRGS